MSKINAREMVAEHWGTHAALANEIGVTRQAIGLVLSGVNESTSLRYAMARACKRHPSEVSWPVVKDPGG